MIKEENIRKVVPYTPGEQPGIKGMIKLNTNENPYPPAKGVYEVLKGFDCDRYRLYPNPKNEPLVTELANYYGVSSDMVFTGIGSDDVLAMCFMAFFNSKKPVLFPDITYSFYDVWADLLRIPYEVQPLNENFGINQEDYFKENGGVIFPNPNAPTGQLESIEFVEEIVKANPEVAVIVDEAYIDFGGESALPLVNKYDNLIVVRTFSKSRSMAGARIGFAIANPVVIKYLNDVKYSFNSYTLDSVTLDAGVAALKDEEYFKECIEKIIKTREWTKEELKKLGFTFGDSKSNFIFATHKSVKASDIFEFLKTKNIFVRYFNKNRIDNYLRITIGTDEEMKIFIDTLKDYLATKN